MDQKTKILSPTADDLRQLIICDTDFSEVGQTDLNPETMQRLEQLGWLAEGDENGEYALTASGRLAVRRALGDIVAFVQFKADRVGRTYIAGPMTGHADFNYPAFNAAAALLRSLGIAAINPADHGVVPGATWEDYLRSDIAQLATCESIYFLPGWSQSRGALLEHHIATSLGMRLLFAEGAEPEVVRLRDELRDRAAFEAWARHIGACIDADADGNYVDSHLNSAKLGWKAALASVQPSPEQRPCATDQHCQNGRHDICLAAQRDDVVCPEDSCDIATGIRYNHLTGPVQASPAGQGGIAETLEGVKAKLHPVEWAILLAGIEAARQPVGQMPEWFELVIRDVCELEPEDPDAAGTVCIRPLDLRLIMERHSPPAQAVDLEQFREAVELMEWQERGHDHPDFPVGDPKKHAEAVRLMALIDSYKAVGNG